MTDGRSLTYKQNSSGGKIPPSGVPEVAEVHGDVLPFVKQRAVSGQRGMRRTTARHDLRCGMNFEVYVRVVYG